MANENSIVEVGIETKVSGEKKIASYTDNLERLDKVKLDNLNKAQSIISNVENRLKGAAAAAERLNKALGTTKTSSNGDRQAQAAQRAAISAQNLANAQTRADQATQRAAVSARNLATAQTRADQSQARAAISAQRIENAQIRTNIQTDRLNRKLSDSSGWNTLQKNINSANRQIGQFGQNLSNAGRSLTAVVTTSISGLAYLSIDSAKNLDTYRNRLTAFEGSVAAAEDKIKILRQLAQDSAGVTTGLALDTYSQLSAIGELTTSTIEKQIKATGKLNSAFSLPDAKEYNRNLVQIFQQGFERQDIKQALGVNPIFEQILEQAFGTKDAEKLRELQKAGKLTLDQFVDGMAEATLNNEKLKGLGDSVGVRLQKTMERISFAFAPLGEAIIKAIEPIIPYLVAFIEYLSNAFAALSPYAQTVGVIFAAIVAAAGPLLLLFGGLISSGSALISFFGTVISGLSALGGAITAIGSGISAFIALVGQAGLTATLSAIVSVVGGSLLTALGAAAVALGKILLAVAAVVAVVVAAGAAIGAVVYLIYRVWQQNIGGIQQKAFAAFNAIKSFIVSTFNQIKKIFEQILPQLETLTKTILSAIQSFWDLHGENIVAIVKVVWNVIKTVITEGINYIGAIIKFTLAVINSDWKTAGEAAAQIVDTSWKIILTIIGAAVRLILEAVQWLFRSLFSLIDEIANIAIELGTQFIKSLVETIRNAPAELAAALDYLVNQAVFDAFDSAYNAGARLWSYLKNGFDGGAASNPVTTPTGEQFIGATASAGAQLTPKGGSGGGGGKKKKGGGKKKTNYEPIDAAALAQADQERQNAQFNIKVELDNLERAKALTQFFGTEVAERLKLASVSITEYYKNIRSERAKDFDLEIEALEEKKKRAELILSKTPVGKSEDSRRERDKQRAEIINLQGEIARKTAEKDLARVETYRNELDAILEIVQANKDLYQTYLDLNDEQRKSAQFAIDNEFGARIEQNRLNLTNAKKALADAEEAAKVDPNNQVLVDRYKLLVETLTKNAEYLESIRTQKELQADFNEQQRQLNLIFDQRQTAIDNLDRKLSETGASDDAATKARREEMAKYETQIDAVIARLEFLSTALKNPEAKKALDELKKQRADERSVPFTEKLRGVQQPFEASLAARDRALKDNELSGDSDFEKQQRRLAILRETTAELLKQADAYVALARESGNPQIIADAEAQRDAIRQNSLEIQSYGKQLKNVAIDAFANGLNQFFNDLASGAVSATDAILNFVGSFVQAIQQMITQILAYMAVALILKALGIPIPASIASGGGVGGKRSGGTARSLPLLPFAGNFATGGAPMANKYAGNILIGAGGLINGAGGPTSDSIPTFFPAARRFGNTSNTEFILNAEATRSIGVPNLERLNALRGNAGNLFARLANRRGNFATGGAASDSVLSGIKQFETPQITGGDNNLELTTLNYFGKEPIEEVIADYGLSPKGDRLLINQFDRNLGKIKAKLGIKGS